MLYRPAAELSWDTWLVAREHDYLLFYIRLTPGRRVNGPAPTIGAGWDGISAASSPDLLHWTEIGPMLEVAEDAAWLGTGMIHRAADRFILNFSEERPVGHQVISFAESTDLVRWHRLSRDFDLRPDESIYQASPHDSADPLPRWDSLGVVPLADKTFAAFVCANRWSPLPGQCGTLGFLRSDDGCRWQQGQPVVEPGLFPSYEVPEHVEFGERHYVIFSTNTTAGPRFDPVAIGAHSGTYYVVADHLGGPYRRPPGDALLLGDRDARRLFGTYVGRPLAVGGDILFYHHWTAAFPDGWWGPPKVLRERRPYELGLDYWMGCEGLKGDLLLDGDHLRVTPLPAAGRVPVVAWDMTSGTVHAENQGGTHGVSLETHLHRESTGYTDLADGRVIEMTIRIARGRGLGVWLGGRATGPRTAILLNAEAGRVEFGDLVHDPNGASERFEPSEHRPWPITIGGSHHLRILARRRFVEVYLDDRLVHCLRLAHDVDPNALGLLSELATGDFLEPRAWAMA